MCKSLGAISMPPSHIHRVTRIEGVQKKIMKACIRMDILRLKIGGEKNE
jgi:hypothetical protein